MHCCSLLVTYSTEPADRAIALALWAIACGLLLGLPPQEVSNRLAVAPLFFPPTFCQAMQKQIDAADEATNSALPVALNQSQLANPGNGLVDIQNWALKASARRCDYSA